MDNLLEEPDDARFEITESLEELRKFTEKIHLHLF